jgi:dolichyldiphosphatase
MSSFEEAPLASLSLTHVHYVRSQKSNARSTTVSADTRSQNPADPISYLCAWLALVPQGLCVVYVTLIWSTREVEIILMFAGQMGCEALNFMLKRWIKEERPRRMYACLYLRAGIDLLLSRNEW